MGFASNCLCISLEVFCFFGVVILNAALYHFIYLRKGGLQPFKRGFFCNDQSIMKPFEQESLSLAGTLTSGIVISLAVIIILEVGNNFSKSKESRNATENDGRKVGPVMIPSYIVRMVHRMAIFGVGLATLLLFCFIVALLTGRLRPHFLAVCKPNKALFNCSDGYITADVCTGDPLKVKYARFSFPSSHTAMSSYCMVFVAICLQGVAVLRRLKLTRLFLQGGLVLLGLAVGLSRVRDYYHHWLDVVGGALIGAFVAWLVAVKTMNILGDVKPSNPYMLLPANNHDDDNEHAEKSKEEFEG